MKKKMRTKAFIALVSLLWIITSFGCAKQTGVQSHWLDREITIDGIDEEWRDCLVYYDENSRSTVGFYNDDKYLYVRLATRNRNSQTTIMGAGLTVWFDPNGGKKEVFGIQFPLGLHNIVASMRSGKLSGMTEGHPPDVNKIQENLMTELSILGPEKSQVRSMDIQDAEFLEKIIVGMDRKADLFAYELKLPIESFINPETNKSVGIGFKAKMPPMEMPQGIPGQMAAKLPGSKGGGKGSGIGGMGGMGGGNGSGIGGIGGMGRGGPSRNFSDDDVEFYVKVALARQ